MSNTAAAEPTPQTDAEYAAEFERIMAESNAIHEQMRQKGARARPLETEASNKTDSSTANIQKISEDLKTLGTEVGELRSEVRALAQVVQQSQRQQRHDRDMAAKDREYLLLRLELYLERAGRSLPPGDGTP